jgi:toxin ParE1/3/4
MDYEIRKRATADLESIWLFTQDLWSEAQADRYLDLIFDELEYLTKFPNAGKDYGHLRKGYRCSKVKSHLIFYRINKENDLIEIMCILHEHMDIESSLPV